jgi:putative hydrolase of the HAD superfamily
LIKAVTFDCWNTILVDDGARAERMASYFRRIFEENKIFLNAEEIETIFADELVLFENYVYSHRKTLNARYRAETILRLAGIELPEERLLRVAHDCDRMALEVRPPLVPLVKETLQELSQSHQVGLICNTGFHGASTLRIILGDYGLLDFFHFLAFSDEIGVAKPHIRIFQAALEGLSRPAGETVHVGDSQPADIEGAKHAGLRALLFSGVSDRCVEETTADAVFRSYRELPELLERLSAG